ncbi:MAG: hypothetical protein ACI8UO_003307 [Verrucomicrobiales bacterium]|jgi:hypothetical protein
MSQTQREKAWRQVIGSTRRKVNTGWWLETLGPLCIGFSILGASTLLYLRTRVWFEEQLLPAILIAAGALALLPILALVFAFRRFISHRQAAVQLETEMRMNNALSAAEAEIGQWPEPPMKPRIRDGYDWNWARLTAPPVIAVLIVAASFLVPMSPAKSPGTGPNAPIAWEEMEDWLKALEEERVVDDEAARELLKQVEQLRNQPIEDWFGHSSLEATDTLRRSLERSVGGLNRDLAKADRSLNAISRYSEQLSEAGREQLAQEYGEAIQGLAANRLPLNQDLLNQLEGLNPQKLDQMTAEERDQLMQKLQQNMEALRKALGENGKNGMPGMGENGQGFGQRDGENMDELMKLLLGEGGDAMGRPGQGGISRGRGDAPMFHKDEESDLGTNNPEGVTNEDLRNAAPGDVLGVGEAEQNIDDSKPAETQDAGAVGSMGVGGERIWQENLLPSEREALRKFFK